MEYQIAISPGLDISPNEFITAWNETPKCQEIGIARLDEAEVKRIDYPLPSELMQTLIFLGGVAGGIALDVVKDVIQEQITKFFEKKLAERKPKVKVEILEVDGLPLLVVKDQNEK